LFDSYVGSQSLIGGSSTPFFIRVMFTEHRNYMENTNIKTIAVFSRSKLLISILKNMI